MTDGLRDEKKIRMDLVDKFINEVKPNVRGVILAGSLAYATKENIRKDSDVDLIVVYDDIKTCAGDYFKEAEYLKCESYDGYLVKRHENIGHKFDLKSQNEYDISLSIHNINYSALQKISYANYETLAYYRQSQKGTSYSSKDFDGGIVYFKPECMKVCSQIGERRIDKVALETSEGKYAIGNDLDKLLSGAKVIFDKDGCIQHILDMTWKNVTQKLVEHRLKNNQIIDADKEDIAPLLCRYEKFSSETKDDIKRKTQAGVKQALSTNNDKIDMLRNILLAKNGSTKE